MSDERVTEPGTRGPGSGTRVTGQSVGDMLRAKYVGVEVWVLAGTRPNIAVENHTIADVITEQDGRPIALKLETGVLYMLDHVYMDEASARQKLATVPPLIREDE